MDIAVGGTIFVLIVLTLVAALLISRRRRRRSLGSSQKAENKRIELTYFSVGVVVAIALIVFSLHLNNEETAYANDPPPGALVVRVVGYQWCWKFDYLGHDVSASGTCNGPSGDPVLMLPAHRAVHFEVISNDVIHGFWIPYLRWKIYAYPDHINNFTATLDQTGSWPGRCSEFCGLYHYRMDFTLRVVPPAQFSSWLQAHHGESVLAGQR